MPRPRAPFFVVFLPLALLAGYMALVYELSLIYAAFGFLTTFLALGALMSWLGLRGLAAQRDLPAEATAGVPFEAAVTVVNRTPALSCMLFSVEDALQRDHEATPRETIILSLRPGERVTARYRVRVDRRGECRPTEVHLRSRFPFGMFEKRVALRVPGSVLVLPRPGRLKRDILLSRESDAAERPSHARGGLGQFHGVRPFVPGDNPRAVHWATSARKGGVWVREFERETDRRLLLVLDASGADLERRITAAATLAAHHIAHGWSVALALRQEKPAWVPFGSGADHLRLLLRALAGAKAPSAPRDWRWNPREARGAHAAILGPSAPEGLAAVASGVTPVPPDHPALEEPPAHEPL